MEYKGINGLVLAGGDSSRMGEDKAFIKYHGVPQFEYLFNILKNYCDNTFISCRDRSLFGEFRSYCLEDILEDIGPLAGLFTMFSLDHNSPWIVVACDYPLIDSDQVKMLINSRDRDSHVTCYAHPETGQPEPFCAIWEPTTQKHIKKAINKNHLSVMKLLRNFKLKTIKSEDPHKLVNINTREARTALEKKF